MNKLIKYNILVTLLMVSSLFGCVTLSDLNDMKTELENMNWIIEGIRDSLQKMRDAKEESEWDTVAQGDESWE